MRVSAVAVVAVVACNANTREQRTSVLEPTPYAGVTSCGPVAPPAPRREPPLPEREPVPSFVAPRTSAADIAPRGNVVEGDLSGEVVNRAIHARAALFNACFMRAEQPHGMRLRAQFTILEDGTTAGIAIHGEIESVDRCICDVFAALEFPRIDARATVTYPLIFN